MRKLKKAAVRLCSFLLAASLLLGSAAPVFAEGATLQDAQTTQNETLTTPESTTPDSSVPASPEPSDSGSTPSDLGSVPAETESTPPESDIVLPDETGSDAESGLPEEPLTGEPDALAPDELSGAEVPKEPPFEALAIAAFTPQAELLEDGQAQLTVTLNREDVAVTYQWQAKKPAEKPELLFDYATRR